MAATYTLVDAQQMHRDHPATFEVPSGDDLAAIAVGDYCKLMFDSTTEDVPAERMWVRVTHKAPGGAMRGTLSNAPGYIWLTVDDVVPFHARNVLDVQPDDGES